MKNKRKLMPHSAQSLSKGFQKSRTCACAGEIRERIYSCVLDEQSLLSYSESIVLDTFFDLGMALYSINHEAWLMELNVRN